MNEEQAAREAMDIDTTKAPSAILRFFDYDHLPTKQGEVSNYFFDLAYTMEEMLPDGPEKSTCLRKLLEAKDAAVRASLDT
jgi:hypothetical protein